MTRWGDYDDSEKSSPAFSSMQSSNSQPEFQMRVECGDEDIEVFNLTGSCCDDDGDKFGATTMLARTLLDEEFKESTDAVDEAGLGAGRDRSKSINVTSFDDKEFFGSESDEEDAGDRNSNENSLSVHRRTASNSFRGDSFNATSNLARTALENDVSMSLLCDAVSEGANIDEIAAQLSSFGYDENSSRSYDSRRLTIDSNMGSLPGQIPYLGDGDDEDD